MLLHINPFSDKIYRIVIDTNINQNKTYIYTNIKQRSEELVSSNIAMLKKKKKKRKKKVWT